MNTITAYPDHSDSIPTTATATRPLTPSRRAVLAGRFLSGFAALFLTLDLTLKLARVPDAVEGTAHSVTPQASYSRSASCSWPA